MGRWLRIALLAYCTWAVSCTWDSYVRQGKPIELPETAPRELRMLTQCQPASGVLACGDRERECNHWYRFYVEKAGELRVRLRFGPAQGQGELARLLVRPLGKPPIGQKVTTADETLEITASVEPDVYGVLVQGAGARRSYELRAARVDPGTPEDESCPAPGAGAPPDA